MLRRFCASVVMVLVALAGSAQETVKKIQALDKIKVTCAEESLLNKTYKVSKDGVILMDFLGAVEIHGLSESEAADRIGKKLVSDRILRKATVEVQTLSGDGSPATVVEKPVIKGEKPIIPGVVKFSGAVQKPGEIAFRDGIKVADVVASAGTVETTDLQGITVRSVDGTVKKVDALNLNDATTLHAGDEVVFGTKPAPEIFEVYVFGGVSKPGLVKLSSEKTVQSAIEAAGGFTETGIKKKVRIERDGQASQTLDMTLPGSDILLKSNDRVVVETVEKRAYVQVEGAVGNPGYFVVTPGMKLGEAISAAGGYSQKARLEKVKITSPGAKKAREVNYKDIEQGYAGDIVLQAGDQITVPGAKKNNSMPIRFAAGVAAVWLLFGR